MGGLHEFERKLIRQRCDEAIKRAKARGTGFGRKHVLDAGERRKIAERYAKGETMADLACDYSCGEAISGVRCTGKRAFRTPGCRDFDVDTPPANPSTPLPSIIPLATLPIGGACTRPPEK